MQNKKMHKCSLKSCVNNENGDCELSLYPYIFKTIQPNKIKCPMLDDDPKKTYEKVKQSGGILGMNLRCRRQLTEKEIDDLKKERRKPRKDKGLQRKVKK